MDELLKEDALCRYLWFVYVLSVHRMQTQCKHNANGSDISSGAGNPGDDP